MKSIENNFDDPKVNELLNKHFIELRSVSPEGSSHVLDIPGLKDPSIRFWSLWEEEELIGCGALKTLEPNHGEFKSIRVADKFRKQKIGQKIVSHLIDRSKQLGFKKLIKRKDLIKSNHLVWFLCTKARNFHTHAKDD